MDPASILHIAGTAASTAKVAWNVGETLYTFFNDVKAVDHVVSGMVSEVKALSSACDLVDERLRHIVHEVDSRTRMSVSKRGKLWDCVKAQVVDSQKSIAQLDVALDTVKKNRSNVFTQAWRQIELNMKTRDIAEARNRIRSHTASLQTVLQTVAIEVCYLAPQRADQQLQTLLDGMTECMAQLQALRQERESATAPDSEAAVIQICEELASEGQSLYASSVANGSLWGEASEENTKVRDWMRDIHAIDKNASTNNPVESIFNFSDDSTIQDNKSESSHIGSNFMSEVLDGVDSDDDFDVELAQEALGMARASFEKEDYTEAKASFEEALKVVRELPMKRQKGLCDTWDLRYMLSVCAFHAQTPTEAEADLLNFIDLSSRHQNKTKQQLSQMCEAGHLLSQVYVKLGRLEQARIYCDNALKGRRRLIGKSDPSTFESIALMARILQLQGHDRRANLHMRMTPDDQRQSLQHAFQGLQLVANKVAEPASTSQQASDMNKTRERSALDQVIVFYQRLAKAHYLRYTVAVTGIKGLKTPDFKSRHDLLMYWQRCIEKARTNKCICNRNGSEGFQFSIGEKPHDFYIVSQEPYGRAGTVCVELRDYHSPDEYTGKLLTREVREHDEGYKGIPCWPNCKCWTEWIKPEDAKAMKLDEYCRYLVSLPTFASFKPLEASLT